MARANRKMQAGYFNRHGMNLPIILKNL